MRSYIEEHCGIQLGHDKEYLIESRLSEPGCRSFQEFYKVLTPDGVPVLGAIESLREFSTDFDISYFNCAFIKTRK